MGWFGASYAYTDPSQFDYTNRTDFFGSSDTQAAQQLNQANGGQVNAQQVGDQTAYNAQANAIGLANSARGGRGNYMMRSAMLQAPQAQQQGNQAAYAQQQANFQNAAAAQNFEQQRRAMVEGQTLNQQRADHNQALRQMQDSNNQFRAANAVMSLGMNAAGTKADNGDTGASASADSSSNAGMADSAGAYPSDYTASDARMKRLLKKQALSSPSVIIMIGHGDHSPSSMGDDDEPDDDEQGAEPNTSQSKAAGADALNAMRALKPANFEYKPQFQGAPGAGDGQYTGIMAQDLQKTPAGASAVSTGPDGMKRVDGAKLATLNSAALSQLTKDVDRLKGAKRG